MLSLATSVAFSFYVDGFDRYDSYMKFYGSIATIIIVMLWLQFNALILIIGFELNAAIAVKRDCGTGGGRGVISTPAARGYKFFENKSRPFLQVCRPALSLRPLTAMGD